MISPPVTLYFPTCTMGMVTAEPQGCGMTVVRWSTRHTVDDDVRYM